MSHICPCATEMRPKEFLQLSGFSKRWCCRLVSDFQLRSRDIKAFGDNAKAVGRSYVDQT